MSLNWITALASLLIAAGSFLLKKSKPPAFGYPRLADFQFTGQRSKFSSLPRALALSALGLFLVAFANPSFKKKSAAQTPLYTEGLAIYLVIDQSGSMQESIGDETKLGFAKKVSAKFVQERKNDLIGLASFARSTDALVPLTLDHDEVLAQLAAIAKVPNKSEEGTAIGYAIYKTANLLSATRYFAQEKGGYDIKNALIILVTDGLQDPNPLDSGNKLRTMAPEEAARFAKEQNVRLYIINVEPKIAEERFAPHRRSFERITKLTGGNFYMADNSTTLEKVYAEINRLEKSKLSEAFPSVKIPLYPYLIGTGMLLLLLSLLLDTTLLRRAP